MGKICILKTVAVIELLLNNGADVDAVDNVSVS